MNPKQMFSFISATSLAFIATGFALQSGSVVAQEAIEEMEEITVEAPIIRRQVGGPAVIGEKTEVMQINRRVSYADLDLSKPADVTELENRIEAAAKESCEKLFDMFLSDPWDRQEVKRCTIRAVNGTDEQVKAAVKSAS